MYTYIYIEREKESATTHHGSHGCLTPTAGRRCPEKAGPNQAPRV